MKLSQAAKIDWDVIIVGAGPAGAVAARQLSLEHLRVLLVDKAPFGRTKVCGCCINAAAIQTLASISLDDILTRHRAVPLKRIQLAAKHNQATLQIEGVSLSRQVFDAALIRAAISAGAIYLPETLARLACSSPTYRQVLLRQGQESTSARTRLVLAADGLGGNLLRRGEGQSAVVQPNSRIGAGTICAQESRFLQPGTIYMACAKNGYVGLVRLEDGRLNVAAALDSVLVRQAGGLGPAVTQVLSDVDYRLENDLAQAPWRGTPPLTRHTPRLASDRVLVLGDAAGYVEPFTGEGMAWALASALAIVSLALEAAAQWSPRIGEAWQQIHQRTILRRQSICRHVAWGLRHSALTHLAIKLLSYHPQLAQPVIKRLGMV